MKPDATPLTNSSSELNKDNGYLYQVNHTVADRFKYVESPDGLVRIRRIKKAMFSKKIRDVINGYCESVGGRRENDTVFILQTLDQALTAKDLAERAVNIVIEEQETKVNALQSRKKKNYRQRRRLEKAKEDLDWIKTHAKEMQPKCYIRKVVAKPITVIGVV